MNKYILSSIILVIFLVIINMKRIFLFIIFIFYGVSQGFSQQSYIEKNIDSSILVKTYSNNDLWYYDCSLPDTKFILKTRASRFSFQRVIIIDSNFIIFYTADIGAYAYKNGRILKPNENTGFCIWKKNRNKFVIYFKKSQKSYECILIKSRWEIKEYLLFDERDSFYFNLMSSQ